MASAPRPAVQPQQFRGVLEKRGADGAWRIRTFSLQKHFLHYHEPGLDVAEHAPSATFDLRELRSVSVARKHGDRELSLVLDETRKHVLCECDPHAGARAASKRTQGARGPRPTRSKDLPSRTAV